MSSLYESSKFFANLRDPKNLKRRHDEKIALETASKGTFDQRADLKRETEGTFADKAGLERDVRGTQASRSALMDKRVAGNLEQAATTGYYGLMRQGLSNKGAMDRTQLTHGEGSIAAGGLTLDKAKFAHEQEREPFTDQLKILEAYQRGENVEEVKDEYGRTIDFRSIGPLGGMGFDEYLGQFNLGGQEQGGNGAPAAVAPSSKGKKGGGVSKHRISELNKASTSKDPAVRSHALQGATDEELAAMIDQGGDKGEGKKSGGAKASTSGLTVGDLIGQSPKWMKDMVMGTVRNMVEAGRSLGDITGDELLAAVMPSADRAKARAQGLSTKMQADMAPIEGYAGAIAQGVKGSMEAGGKVAKGLGYMGKDAIEAGESAALAIGDVTIPGTKKKKKKE